MRTPWPGAMSVLCAACVLPLAGCSDSSGRSAIAGTVSYKGAPLPQGAIIFIPVDSTKGTQEGAVIANGKYAVPADKGLLPGTYRVSISSVQAKGGADPGAPPDGPPGAPKGGRELLPAQYNTQSTLTIDVTAGGQRAFDFPLD